MELKNYEVVSCEDISIDKDYPENVDELVDEWFNGNMNNLKVGDRVQLRYLMNTDGIYKPLRFKNQIGTIKEIKKRRFQEHNGNWLVIDWDNKELNTIGYDWIPYQFIKINSDAKVERGKRREMNIIEEKCDINNLDL